LGLPIIRVHPRFRNYSGVRACTGFAVTRFGRVFFSTPDRPDDDSARKSLK
jgi:hypothetical protein